MTAIEPLHRDLVSRVREGAGLAPGELRQAAFDNAGLAEPMRILVDKVAQHAYQVTDEDVAAIRAAGFSEDQIFELVVCAAIGQATRQYDAARSALDRAEGI